jgi:hypothetical protein
MFCSAEGMVTMTILGISVFGILQIKERKKDYNSTAHFKPKDRIAHEILGSVHANHGRFVR